MIRTIMLISLRRLWHNKPELVLTFVVPLIFFSIFAWIFGSRGSRVDDRQLKVVICDEVGNEWSRQAIKQMANNKRLIVMAAQRQPASQSTPQPGSQSDSQSDVQPATPPGTVSRQQALRLVRRGLVSAAIVIMKKPATDAAGASPSSKYSVKVLNDSFDQLASRVVAPLVQQSLVQFPAFALASGPVQPAAYAASSSAPAVSASDMSMPQVDVVDVLGAGKSNPVIAMYAAGIAVMFLLFSATTASGSLLEEKENSTLERILCSRATMDHLLLGKWCYLTLIGCAQMTLMFVWGMVAFHLNLQEHLDGFAIMTLVTSGAAAGFALMLAALCRSRTQLGWVSTIVILSMSALGGSMVPRYLMGPSIQRVGQLTFNAWALDGYNKIFWRELPLLEIRNELLVLTACGLVFMVIARLAAIRWERS